VMDRAPRGLRGGERAALIISECQRAMAAEARRCEVPVVHCTIAPRGDFSGTAVSSPLMAAIWRSRLRQGNAEAQIDDAVAPVALPGTTIEAADRGYSVVVPEDCTA